MSQTVRGRRVKVTITCHQHGSRTPQHGSELLSRVLSICISILRSAASLRTILQAIILCDIAEDLLDMDSMFTTKPNYFHQSEDWT